MYETTKGEKVDPKPESCPKRAEGSSAKAGTVNHCGQKAAPPKQERLTIAGRRQLAQSRKVAPSGQNATRPMQER
jgi:hypothetical protein